MNAIKFVSSPLSAVFCATCMQWGGARVTKDGQSVTGASFNGSCKSAIPVFEQDNLQDMQKNATFSDCKYWEPISFK